MYIYSVHGTSSEIVMFLLNILTLFYKIILWNFTKIYGILLRRQLLMRVVMLCCGARGIMHAGRASFGILDSHNSNIVPVPS